MWCGEWTILRFQGGVIGCGLEDMGYVDVKNSKKWQRVE